MQVETCPNECFAASNTIQSLTSSVEDYEAVWYLTRLKKALDEVVDAFKQKVSNSNKDLIAKSQMNIPEETEAETKAMMAKERADAKEELNEIYRKDGDKKATLDLPALPHEKVWAHIRPEMRGALAALFPFLTKPKDVVE